MTSLDATDLPSIQEITDNRRPSLFVDVARLNARIQAHQAPKRSAAMTPGDQLDAAGLELENVHVAHGFSKLAMEHH